MKVVGCSVVITLDMEGKSKKITVDEYNGQLLVTGLSKAQLREILPTLDEIASPSFNACNRIVKGE